MGFVFYDRKSAGRELGEELRQNYGDLPPLVLALPRGGVPVAYEVAKALNAPLDIFLVRKLGIPGHEEYAMGAIATGGVLVLNREAVSDNGISDQVIEQVAAKERQELARREREYRRDVPPAKIRGREVILVDDGLATGATMRAAVTAVKRLHPKRITVAIPVGASDTCESLSSEVDDLVCLQTPDPFNAVGNWYDDFSQTSDEEVQTLLENSRKWGET